MDLFSGRAFRAKAARSGGQAGRSLACQDISVTNMAEAFQRLDIKPGPAFQRRAVRKMHTHQLSFKRGECRNPDSYAFIAVQTGEHLGSRFRWKFEEVTHDTAGTFRFIKSAVEGAIAEKAAGHSCRSCVAAATVEEWGVGIRGANAKRTINEQQGDQQCR